MLSYCSKKKIRLTALARVASSPLVSSPRLVARPPPALDLTRAPPRRRGDRARARASSSRRTEEDLGRSPAVARALVVASARPAASSIGDLAARSSVATDNSPGYRTLASADADADGRSWGWRVWTKLVVSSSAPCTVLLLRARCVNYSRGF